MERAHAATPQVLLHRDGKVTNIRPYGAKGLSAIQRWVGSLRKAASSLQPYIGVAQQEYLHHVNHDLMLPGSSFMRECLHQYIAQSGCNSKMKTLMHCKYKEPKASLWQAYLACFARTRSAAWTLGRHARIGAPCGK